MAVGSLIFEICSHLSQVISKTCVQKNLHIVTWKPFFSLVLKLWIEYTVNKGSEILAGRYVIQNK